MNSSNSGAIAATAKSNKTILPALHSLLGIGVAGKARNMQFIVNDNIIVLQTDGAPVDDFSALLSEADGIYARHLNKLIDHCQILGVMSQGKHFCAETKVLKKNLKVPVNPSFQLMVTEFRFHHHDLGDADRVEELLRKVSAYYALEVSINGKSAPKWTQTAVINSFNDITEAVEASQGDVLLAVANLVWCIASEQSAGEIAMYQEAVANYGFPCQGIDRLTRFTAHSFLGGPEGRQVVSNLVREYLDGKRSGVGLAERLHADLLLSN